MESPKPSDKISMFPNRRTIDALASDLSNPQELETHSLDYLEAIIELIDRHPDTTPAHYSMALPSIENALNHLDISESGALDYPSIERALLTIMNEHHPSFLKLRTQARSLYEAFFSSGNNDTH